MLYLYVSTTQHLCWYTPIRKHVVHQYCAVIN